jgi:hypothetical protein
VREGLVHALVGVLKLDVLADDAISTVCAGYFRCAHVLPAVLKLLEVREAEVREDELVHVLALQHEGHLVDGISTSRSSITALTGTLQKRLNSRASLGDGLFRAADKDVGWMPISRSFATLCWLGFVLSSPAAAR